MLSPVCRPASSLFLLETPDLPQYLSTKIFVFNAVGDDNVGDSDCSNSAMVSRQRECCFGDFLEIWRFGDLEIHE